MNSFQIESWALRVIDQVKAGQPNEDFRVELKREWPEPKKAARHIAGLANAARGESILWLIGVDERNQLVVGASNEELANWYSTVKAQFDEGIVPTLTNLNITFDDQMIVALFMETDRPPYVVKNPDGGTIQYEVPWREGNRTRSAHRSDLIRLLAPLEPLPDVEVLWAGVRVTEKESNLEIANPRFDEVLLGLKLYVVPKNDVQVVIPLHHCKAWYEVKSMTPQKIPLPIFSHRIPADSPNFSNAFTRALDRRNTNSSSIQATETEIVINGPGKLELGISSHEKPDLLKFAWEYNALFTVHLFPVRTDRPIVISKEISSSSFFRTQ